jgi:uncharacterized protein (TIGR02996 family)
VVLAAEALREANAMTEAEALVRAVVADRGDRTTQLVFADWLEEQGDPELAEQLRASPEGMDLLPPWLLPAGEVEVGSQVVVWQAQGWAVRLLLGSMAWMTCRSLEVRCPVDDGLALAMAGYSAPALSWLELHGAGLSLAGALAVAESPNLPRLGFLVLNGDLDVTEDGWAELAVVRPQVLRSGWEDFRDGSWCDCQGECSGCYSTELDVEGDLARLAGPRADRDRHGPRGPGFARKRWWGGYQVSQVRGRRQRGGKGR